MKPLKNNNYKLAIAGAMVFGALTGLLAPAGASASVLNAGNGTFTINFDRNAFASLAMGTPSSPGIYTSHFYNTAESDYTMVTAHNMSGYMGELPGANYTTEVSSTGLVHDLTSTSPITATQASGRAVQATTANFGFNTADNSGTGALGMTGVQKIYVPAYGAMGGMAYGDYSLKYDAAQRNATQSGWFLENHVGMTADVYDLANLNVSAVDANHWQLTGELLMSSFNASMLMGTVGANMGNFSLVVGSGVSAVPVPGAVWLFGSGLAGLMMSARRKARIFA